MGNAKFPGKAVNRIFKAFKPPAETPTITALYSPISKTVNISF
jgi:hypothetical protein